MDGAGYPGGRGFPPVEFLIDPFNEPPAGYLVEQWKENLGVEIAYRVVEMDEFLSRLADRPPQIFFGVWFADYPDPDNFLRVCEAVRWARWQDESYLTIFNKRSDQIASWDQHNATLVFESGNGRWSARAWIRNIEDDTHITGGLRGPPNQDFAVTEPRTYGASFRFSFGAL